jgi:succinate dehydrogenase / fumarate reductase iron-sulfur subunit
VKLHIEVWRENNTGAAAEAQAGHFESYVLEEATPEMSLLDMIDRLNEGLIAEGQQPVAYDSDCREGICGCCGMMVDGRPHGPVPNTPSCRQHLRSFHDGDRIRLEPLRSASFPVVRDLVVDRSALDRILEAGAYVSVDAGTAPDADSQLTNHDAAEKALDYAACIGCGACVAACPNGAAHLFTGAKLVHLATTVQGKQERRTRAKNMIAELEQDFGPCSNYGECADVCPAGIPLGAVSAVNRETLRSVFHRS